MDEYDLTYDNGYKSMPLRELVERVGQAFEGDPELQSPAIAGSIASGDLQQLLLLGRLNTGFGIVAESLLTQDGTAKDKLSDGIATIVFVALQLAYHRGVSGDALAEHIGRLAREVPAI